MVRTIGVEELDPIVDAVDIPQYRAPTESNPSQQQNRPQPQFLDEPDVGDLSDGGRIGDVILTPMADGISLERGRAVALRAWTWNGHESLLPLAWQPGGKVHDGARHYRLKRFCYCCRQQSFMGNTCPRCLKKSCNRCNSGRIKKDVIAAFYLRYEDVPYKEEFYGKVPCFLASCIRTADRGFKNNQEMRFHARSRHRIEYQAFIESQQDDNRVELESLRRRLDAMSAPQTQAMTSAVEAEVEAPLYVSKRDAEAQLEKEAASSPRRGRPRGRKARRNGK